MGVATAIDHYEEYMGPDDAPQNQDGNPLSLGLDSDDASTITPPSQFDDGMAGIPPSWSKPRMTASRSAEESGTYPEAMKCSIGKDGDLKTGMAVHVTLTYASGGQLVTSMGHWIELTRINTSEEELFNVAAKNFGQAELEDMREDFAKQSCEMDREFCRQKWAKSSISKSVPTRMKC